MKVADVIAALARTAPPLCGHEQYGWVCAQPPDHDGDHAVPDA